jgi:hypothetical protein
VVRVIARERSVLNHNFSVRSPLAAIFALLLFGSAGVACGSQHGAPRGIVSLRAAVRWFHSPGEHVGCEVSAAPPRGTYSVCVTDRPWRTVTLDKRGRVSVCRSCRSNDPENSTLLRYGKTTRVGPFRCTSLPVGIRCLVLPSRHGFLLGRRRFSRL